MRHIRRKAPFSAPCAILTPIKAYQTWYRLKSQPSDPQRSQKRCPGLSEGWDFNEKSLFVRIVIFFENQPELAL